MQHSESSGGAASDHTNIATTTGGEDSSEATGAADAAPLSRYESQKKRDWTTFLQYLKTHKPPLSLASCSGFEVIEFMKYLDQFGKTRVHESGCIYFGCQDPPTTCGCPLKQAWGSLDSLIGRLRAAYEENGSGGDFINPFGSKDVRSYLMEVRDGQAKARGIPYGKKRKRLATAAAAATGRGSSSTGGCSSGDASTG